MTRASPFDRLRDIIDENFGMQPVMTDDDALSFLEGRLFADRVEYNALRAVADAAKDVCAVVPPHMMGHARASKTVLVVDALRDALDALDEGKGGGR